ncbi:hypothetical protein N3K66_002611 [Trichothecium roseum]|uniref:Uncharacterized protein n=1 Tax=Trichothecium roseum TaxID=47278 RepID=A0ACC0VAC8_9HYPO|nr:hypothetical protein N3K66_002611 [Trichothecium roseum]
MSENTPESIPTSADPKSRRPTKRRALTPLSAQAASVEALFANPTQNIRTEPRPPRGGGNPGQPGGAGGHHHLPPEIVANVQGSSAGAGSGEFHVYKASRRREYERLRGMDAEVKREKEGEEFEKGMREKAQRDEEKTRRNREKRDKARARKAGKGKGGNGGGTGGTGATTKTAPGGAGVAAAAAAGDEAGRTKADGAKDNKHGGDGDDGTEKASEQPAGIVIHDDD